MANLRGGQILSISCSLWENLAKWYVSIGASTSGNPGSASVLQLCLKHLIIKINIPKEIDAPSVNDNRFSLFCVIYCEIEICPMLRSAVKFRQNTPVYRK